MQLNTNAPHSDMKKNGPDTPASAADTSTATSTKTFETQTWETTSETSSVWTDSQAGVSTGDRTSRRALILQMAKARMTKQKDDTPVNVVSPPPPPPPNTAAPTSAVDDQDKTSDVMTAVDFTGDLD